MTLLPQYIDAADVKRFVVEEHPHVVVVDVRDEDFAGGHIKGAKNIPSESFRDETSVDSVIAELPKDAHIVILHCQLSQIRGPKCAKRLAERLQSKTWADHPNKPQIKILRGGFENFHEQFAGEPDLFEDLK